MRSTPAWTLEHDIDVESNSEMKSKVYGLKSYERDTWEDLREYREGVI
jgi:hypothetical protein